MLARICSLSGEVLLVAVHASMLMMQGGKPCAMMQSLRVHSATGSFMCAQE